MGGRKGGRNRGWEGKDKSFVKRNESGEKKK